MCKWERDWIYKANKKYGRERTIAVLKSALCCVLHCTLLFSTCLPVPRARTLSVCDMLSPSWSSSHNGPLDLDIRMTRRGLLRTARRNIDRPYVQPWPLPWRWIREVRRWQLPLLPQPYTACAARAVSGSLRECWRLARSPLIPRTFSRRTLLWSRKRKWFFFLIWWCLLLMVFIKD